MLGKGWLTGRGPSSFVSSTIRHEDRSGRISQANAGKAGACSAPDRDLAGRAALWLMLSRSWTGRVVVRLLVTGLSGVVDENGELIDLDDLGGTRLLARRLWLCAKRRTRGDRQSGTGTLLCRTVYRQGRYPRGWPCCPACGSTGIGTASEPDGTIVDDETKGNPCRLSGWLLLRREHPDGAGDQPCWTCATHRRLRRHSFGQRSCGTAL